MEIPEDFVSCPQCGTPAPAAPAPGDPVRLDFTGGPLGVLQCFLLTIVGTLLVIPLAWVSAGVARWISKNTTFSDGTTVEFRGTGEDVLVWHIFYVLTLVGQQVAFYAVGDAGIAAYLAVFLISYVVLIAIIHTLIKWFVFNAQLSSGPQLSFVGGFAGLFGWYLALAVSAYSIVGWAWVVAGMYRWLARHVRGRGVVFAFEGSGVEILWRGAVTAVGTFFIIPIPWVWLWFARWLVQQVTMTRKEEDELTVPV